MAEEIRIPDKGERFGRLRVSSIARHGRSKSITITCVCECGEYISRTPRTIIKTDKQMCKKCEKRLANGEELPTKEVSAELENNPCREFTEDTEWLICLWHSEGDDYAEIASTLKRDVSVIEETVERCKADGSYERYAKRSMKHREIYKERDFHKGDIRSGKMPKNHRIRGTVSRVNKGYV